MLGVVGSSLKSESFNTQNVATRRNMTAKRAQHVAPNNVGLCSAGMLQSFRRGLSHYLQNSNVK